MATVYVNDIEVEIGDEERLNLIQAAQRAGVFVPHYCWHPALTVVASCRMCLVEVGQKTEDGVSMMPKVVPGCQTPAKDGTVIVTDSETAKKAQAGTLEGLLLNHPLDCPVCDKAGECTLQDYSYRYGNSHTRMIDEKRTPPNKPHIGDNVTLFTDRCIMCSRCVRFTREISGEAELQVVSRGHHAEIDIFPGEPLDNKLSTNVVDLCPVGALCSKDFLYKHRVWNLKTVDSVCVDCSTGCSIHLDTNKTVIYRLRPRENQQAQGWFMCDEGRLGYHYCNDDDRLSRPSIENSPRSWQETLDALRKDLEEAIGKDAGSVVAILSPFMTCEEAFLLSKYLKSLSGQIRLALGPVPVIGEDDNYPKDRKGNSIEPVKFTIRAEKCPNRRGVEEVLQHFQGEIISFDEVVRSANDGQIHFAYLVAGYPPRGEGWINQEQADALKKATCLVVQDILPSTLSASAKYVLPGATFAEKDGSVVNHKGLAQSLKRGANPVGEVRQDGQVFQDLMQRPGLFHLATIRQELASEINYFSRLPAMTEQGVFLEQSGDA